MVQWVRPAALFLLALTAASQAGERRPLVANAAVVDFAVGGVGEPRYWLGHVYAEVLARRLNRCNDLLVVEPLVARQRPSTTAAQDPAGVGRRCLELLGTLSVPYVISGFIEDRGATLNVTASVAAASTGKVWSLVQETPADRPFQPQIDLVVRRFLPNIGVRIQPADLEAMVAYDPALSPEVMALVGQGWRAYAPDEPEDAFKLWRHALQLDPNCGLAAEALASAGYLYRRKLIQQALETYERQVTMEPGNALARYHLGQLYGDLGRWGEAEIQFIAAIERRNTFLDAYLALAQARIEQGLFEKAILACDSALMVSPDNLKALHNKAVALYGRGLVPQAKEMWLRILEISPEDALARQNLERYGRPSTAPGLQ